MTVKLSTSADVAAALPVTARGPKEWAARAKAVEQRHRYHCTDVDTDCNYTEPHKHGTACDYTCKCKGPTP